MSVHQPQNVIQIQDFTVAPDEPYVIGVSEIVFLMPIFKWNGTDWQDAVGNYDLCMSPDYLKFTFINRLATTERFAYRFIARFWLASKLQRL